MRILQHPEREFPSINWRDSFNGSSHRHLSLNEGAFASPLYDNCMLYCAHAIKQETLPRHQGWVVHPDYLSFRFIEFGTEFVFYKGHYYLAEPGDLMIFSPFLDFAFYTAPHATCVKYNLTMKGTALQSIASNNLLFKHPFIHLSDPAIYLETFHRLKRILSDESRPQRAENASLCFGFLQSIHDSQQCTVLSQQMQDMVSFIEQHLGAPLCLSTLAETFGMASSTMNRLFHDTFGMPTWRYVTKRKMELSVPLLTERMLSVKETAALLGFATQFSFSREFKKYFGLSPVAYRAKNHSNQPRT